MGLLFREHQRLITAPRIFAVLVNDVYKFYYMCMVKFINLRLVNYYFF